MPQTRPAALSPQSYSRLQCPSGKVEHFFSDTGSGGVTGLTLKVTRAGNRTWVLRYRLPGQKSARHTIRKLKIGDATVLSLTDARSLARSKLADIDRGIDPSAVKKSKSAAATVSAAIERYDETLAARSYVNRKTVMSTIRRGLHGRLSDPVASLSLHELVAIIEGKAAEGLEGAAEDFRSRCSAFLSWAAAQGLIPTNPLLNYRKSRATRVERTTAAKQGRALSLEEVAAVWRAAGDMDAFGQGVRLLTLTGMRRGEVFGLTAGMIHGTWIDLPATFTKQARGHRVPITAGVRHVLGELPYDNGLLFRSSRRTEPTPISGFSKLIKRLISSSGVSFTLHDLRRTVRSQFTKTGVPDAIAEAAIGHVDGDTLKRIYSRPNWETELRQAFDDWSKMVETAVGTSFSSSDRPDNIVVFSGERV